MEPQELLAKVEGAMTDAITQYEEEFPDYRAGARAAIAVVVSEAVKVIEAYAGAMMSDADWPVWRAAELVRALATAPSSAAGR